MTPARTALLGAVLAALAGCGGCDTVPENAVTDCEAAEVAAGVAKTDILFVVDDSPSMAVEQDNLAANFAAFIQELSSSPVANDFQIAITTTSVDRNGGGSAGTTPPLVTTFSSGSTGSGPNAGLPYPAGALVSVDATGLQLTSGPGRILSSTSPTLVADFEQNVKVGIYGSGKEQPLRAAKLALTDPLLGLANSGFLRPGARLAVVIVTDDDDCSDPGNAGVANVPNSAEGSTCESFAEPTADFSDFLRGPIAGEQRDTLVGVIASFDPTTLQPAVCDVLAPDGSLSGKTSEYQAVRLGRFADALGTNAIRASVCSATFHDALATIADRLVPQTFPLQGTPADWRLLVVQRTRGGTSRSCSVALAGSASADTADAVYAPSGTGDNPTLTMQGNCRLAAGDGISVHILCAG